MARMVTGSVADNVAPTDMASTKLIFTASIGILDHKYRMTASTTAEMNVPANAKVRIVPMLRKKLPCGIVSMSGDAMSFRGQSHTWCSSYPEFRIIGGRRRLKKNW